MPLADFFSYTQSDSKSLFQSPYCKLAPASNDTLIAYMQHEHITRVWSNNFVGNPITFKTGESIIAADPIGFSQSWLNRVPVNFQAVEHADKPSLLYYARMEDEHPEVLHHLEQDHITYRVVRFPSQPGVDVLLITPLNQSVPIVSGAYGDFACVL